MLISLGCGRGCRRCCLQAARALGLLGGSCPRPTTGSSSISSSSSSSAAVVFGGGAGVGTFGILDARRSENDERYARCTHAVLLPVHWQTLNIDGVIHGVFKEDGLLVVLSEAGG